MPSQTEPRSGLRYGWPVGYPRANEPSPNGEGWKPEMDANLLRLGRFGFHLSVKSRTTLEVPETPSTGDSYIVPELAEEDWLGQDGRVALWSGEAWVFAAPRTGWVAYIEDEEVLCAYKPTGWSAGISI